VLSQREIKNIHKGQEEGLIAIDYVAKKPGLYRLYKVVDRTKLEVQRRMSDTLVVTCPRAEITPSTSNKCIGDLSNLTMKIRGIAPLKIRYSRTVGSEKSVHDLQSLAPDNFESPLLGSTYPRTLVKAGSQDVSWARTQVVDVPLNESMSPSGKWSYAIDQIRDAIGNVVNFTSEADDALHTYPKGTHMEQIFQVSERPVAQLAGCDSRSPLTVAKGQWMKLSVDYKVPGRLPDDTSHTVYWKFSPLDTLTKSGDHGSEVIFEEHAAKNAHDRPLIREPGLYTLVGVKSLNCDGQIEEPASCLLLNPPEPQLSIQKQNLTDKCAGNPIGVRVDLDLIGTPPFIVRYDITTKSGLIEHKMIDVRGLRYQLELRPKEAGHFKYQFTSLDDKVYKGYPLIGENMAFEQDVKPPASAQLRIPSSNMEACIEEPIEMNVELSGEPPFILEYELVHDGHRTKSRIPGIDSYNYKIKTEPLTKGGEYNLAVTSIQDTTDCKIFLDSSAAFKVRRQRPKAAFGQIEGKFKTVEVEGKPVDLPLRLTGRAPWNIKYRNLNDKSGKISEKTARSKNDFIKVVDGGVYEILEVFDDQCPGTVDPAASKFAIDWLPRPQIKLSETAVLIPDGSKYVKREVCEGDVDAVEVALFGKNSFLTAMQYELILIRYRSLPCQVQNSS